MALRSIAHKNLGIVSTFSRYGTLIRNILRTFTAYNFLIENNVSRKYFQTISIFCLSDVYFQKLLDGIEAFKHLKAADGEQNKHG